MTARRQRSLAVLVSVCATCVCARALAIGPSNILVLYNPASSDGYQIASYYAQVHPGVRLLGLQNVPVAEETTYDVYLNVIRPAVLAGLNSSTDCIVTTKGLPLRIDNPMPSGWGGSWNRYSSLESELARVDSINTPELMGNQSYLTSNRLAYNPYFYKSGGFDYDVYGTRLTARLDGFTVGDVQAEIDRSQRAVYDRPGYVFLLDDYPGKTSRMPQLRDGVLIPRSRPYTYDGTTTFIRTAPSPGAVLGYVSHGANGGAPGDYLSNPATGVTFDEAKGGIFHTWESYNAYTFDANRISQMPVRQGLVAEWIARGGTAGTGQVWEPYVSTSNVTREDRMFQMMLDGYTFAEAAWNATTQLSYVNTVVGDPLMTWKQWVGGDFDLDGDVDLFDLGGVTAAYGTHVGDAKYNLLADMNANGSVDLWDLMYAESHYTGPLTAFQVQAAVDRMLAGAPEPASLLFMLIGGLALLRRKGR